MKKKKVSLDNKHCWFETPDADTLCVLAVMIGFWLICVGIAIGQNCG